jgi:hypothetical protein
LRLLLAPAMAGLWTVWQKLMSPSAPVPLTLAGADTLVRQSFLRRHAGQIPSPPRQSDAGGVSLARNDALANIALIVAGAVIALRWRSAWPDLIVGIGIAIMNADAAREVFAAARAEHEAAA